MESSKDPFWKRAVGRCPKWHIQIDGVEVEATVDTGSQVTTLSETWFRRHLAMRKMASPSVRWLRLSAANGQTIDSVGYLSADITVREEVIRECPVFIIKSSSPDDPQPECLLGMNVIQQLKDCPKWLQDPDVLPTLGNITHAPRTDIWVPAHSVCNLTVTAADPSLSLCVLFEPLESGPRAGLSALPVFTKLHNGRLRIPVVNSTDDDLLLPARAPLGHVIAAKAVDQPTVSLVTAECSSGESRDIHQSLPHNDPPACPNTSRQSTGPSGNQLEEKLDSLKINTDLSPTQQVLLRDVLRRYANCFAWADSDLGYTSQVEHEIFLTDVTPISQAYRRIPPAALGEVKKHLQDLLERDIIAPSSSSYAAPIVVVRKKSGEIRLCVDYRRLNAVTRKDAFPLPRIDESLDALGGSKFFSTLDLASGYYQVKMSDADAHKTAFTCPFGLYEFKRMPFGLSNAPATFQRLMNSTMSDFIFSILLVYLDDLLVYSSDFEKHIAALEAVLDRLQQVGVKLNPEKCDFAQDHVHFLGHVVSAKGVATDPGKISAIEKWQVPSTVKEVRSFLGLASYYRRFVRDL